MLYICHYRLRKKEKDIRMYRTQSWEDFPEVNFHKDDETVKIVLYATIVTLLILQSS